jgi:hypothetical protein
VGTAKSYAERLFNFPSIGRLDDASARAAIEKPAEEEGVTFEPGATAQIVAFTEGYPYFLQEYAKHVWNLAEGPPIELHHVQEARPLVQLQLDENFFRVRIGRVSTAELQYLAAMADLGTGPYKSGEIATKLGRSGPQQVAPLRARLINKGLIYSPGHGLSEFTVPQFDDFMRRTYPLKNAE